MEEVSRKKPVIGWRTTRIAQELRRVPRHQWDDYLWKLCEEVLATRPESVEGAEHEAEPSRAGRSTPG